MKFEHIYSFQALDSVDGGKKVYVLDKKTRTVANVADMRVGMLTDLLKKAKDDESRFDFWIEKEEKENA